MLKAFWFTNILLPELAESFGRKSEVTGAWMLSFLDVIHAQQVPC